MSKEKIDVRWFNDVGIVRVENDYDIRYYIGTHSGTDELNDMMYIRHWGSPFPSDAGTALFLPEKLSWGGPYD